MLFLNIRLRPEAIADIMERELRVGYNSLPQEMILFLPLGKQPSTIYFNGEILGEYHEMLLRKAQVRKMSGAYLKQATRLSAVCPAVWHYLRLH